MFKKSFILSLLILSFSVVSVFSEPPADKNCYSVYSESLTGAIFDAPSYEPDSMKLEIWQGVSSQDMDDSPKEGSKYFRFSCNVSSDWWGLAFRSTNDNLTPVVYNPDTGKTDEVYGCRDMSAYIGGKLKFFARSLDSKVLNCKVGIVLLIPNGNGGHTQTNIYRTLSSLGFSANGQWQELVFPLTSSNNSSITADNLKKVMYFFVVTQNNNLEKGNSIDIDYVRWVKESVPTELDTELKVSLKDVSSNSDVTGKTISWSSDCGGYISDLEAGEVSFVSDTFQKGWTVATKYLEIDLTGFDADLSPEEIPKGDYSISIYVENSSPTRNGLYTTTGSGQDIVLPMAWRVNKDLISPATPTEKNINSFLIKEKVDKVDDDKYEGHLLDANYDKVTYAWYYFVDSSEFGIEGKKDYVKIWSYKKGLRYGEGPEDMGHVGETKPKVYLALNTKDALGGLIYESENIKVELAYE